MTSDRSLFCIPSTSGCPITHIYYDANGNLQTSTDPSKGAPIVDVKLSQHGPPCINYKHDFNSYTDKTRFGLFNFEYNKGCTSQKIDGKKYYTAENFHEVNGFTPTNEYDLLKQNEFNHMGDQWNYVKKLPNFKVDTLRNYEYKMYVAHFTELGEQCTYTKMEPPTAEPVKIVHIASYEEDHQQIELAATETATTGDKSASNEKSDDTTSKTPKSTDATTSKTPKTSDDTTSKTPKTTDDTT